MATASAERSTHPLFPQDPAGWYYAANARKLKQNPLALQPSVLQRVVFRSSGNPVVLDARCSHMGADLSRGTLDGDLLRCPLHAWAYGSDGRCRHIPAGTPAPHQARQRAFPTAPLGDHLFYYNGDYAEYPVPFYDGVAPEDLHAAPPFELTVETPWYLVAANGFDLQHFAVAHDRTLVGDVSIESPSPFARRMTATFDVTGSTWRDGLTRRASGPQVCMSVTSWSGTLVLVTAKFQRTTSYGLVAVTPLSEFRSHLRTIIWVPRRRRLGGPFLDPVDAFIRRAFIRAFVTDDAVVSTGIRYNPKTLIDADRELSAYLHWLAALHTSPASPLEKGAVST